MFADLKNRPLAQMTSKSFDANGGVLTVAAVAFNLTRALGVTRRRALLARETATSRAISFTPRREEPRFPGSSAPAPPDGPGASAGGYKREEPRCPGSPAPAPPDGPEASAGGYNQGVIMDDLVSGLIGVLVTAAVSAIVARYHIGRARRLWRLSWPMDVTIVLSASARVNTSSYVRPVTGLGPARALGIVAGSLGMAYPGDLANSVFLSDGLDGTFLERDLILLGGPKNNEITRHVMDRLSQKCPLTMITNGDEQIVWRTGPNSKQILDPASAPAPSRGRAGRDYGLIIRTENVFNPRRTMLVLAGTHTYGTVAAARYFLDNAKAIRKLGNRSFALVVAAHVDASEHVHAPCSHLGPVEF